MNDILHYYYCLVGVSGAKRTELDGYCFSPVLPHVELCLHEIFIPNQGSLGSEGRIGIPSRKMAEDHIKWDASSTDRHFFIDYCAQPVEELKLHREIHTQTFCFIYIHRSKLAVSFMLAIVLVSFHDSSYFVVW